MKKALLILILLALVMGGWLVSRMWSLEREAGDNNATAQEPADVPTNRPDSTQEPEPEPEPCTEEEDRLREEELQAEIAAKREYVLEESRSLFIGYFYEEAVELLNEDELLINNETQALEAEVLAAIDRRVLFEGEVKHIFFHSLILYPEHIYHNITSPSNTYAYFLYQRELERLLPQLYERGYVLYDINLVFSRNDDGVMQRNDIYLPPGKKPLIISLDDMNYHYGVGFAHRVILDENGELATEVITPQGDKIITYDGDTHLMIDDFVRENPGFSYRGHKGILAVTGSAATRRRQPDGSRRNVGIFGYYLDDEQDWLDAKAVSAKFIENGWLFANHSFTHNANSNRGAFWAPGSVPDLIRNDVRRWREQLEPLIGPTNLFIAPGGFLLRGESMQIIIDNGYDIYCTVDSRQTVNIHPTHVVMGRIEISWWNLIHQATALNRDFFDVASVIDSHRPPLAPL